MLFTMTSEQTLSLVHSIRVPRDFCVVFTIALAIGCGESDAGGAARGTAGADSGTDANGGTAGADSGTDANGGTAGADSGTDANGGTAGADSGTDANGGTAGADSGSDANGGTAGADSGTDAGDSGTTPTATLLFASNFGPGVSLNAPHGFAGTAGAWQDLLGTDLETGFTFPGPNAPNALLDAHFFGVQLIAPVPINASTVGDHVVNEIRQVPGPNQSPVYSLYQNVKTGGGWAGQSPFLINRDWNHGEVTDLYISYWLRYPDNAASQLYYPYGSTRVLFEFKTGGYENDWRGDYRIISAVKLDPNGHLYWAAIGDNVANGPFGKVEYWREDNVNVPVPIGEWFFHELYWHRSNANDGRFWSAVNGQVLFDRFGPNMGDFGLPVTRIMITNAYTGGNAPIEQNVTGLEIWDGFPCGEGVPCYPD